ncbi:MAG: CRTAC1 family protein [Halobacteriales archaeon]|nr:CRTAC1 family protein [Halobacteriales archaeon]
MVLDRSTTEVVVALLVAVGVTLLLLGNPFDGDTTGKTAPEIETEMRGGGYVPSPVHDGNVSFGGEPPESVNEMPEFVEVSRDVGFEYGSEFVGSGIVTSSGVYVVDFDNDGYEDILATGGEMPVLFENTDGGFEERRTFDHKDTRTAHFFDYDNDGYRDLLLAEFGGGFVFYENEDGEFQQRDVGLDTELVNPTTINTADVTGNGCLDLFVGQYGVWARNDPIRPDVARDVMENHPDVRPETTSANENLLFQGDCEGFDDITEQAGIRGDNWTLASSTVDFTGDGYPDIHVGNDFNSDVLYTNNGDGTFERRSMGPETDRNAMSSTVADVDGDGALDIFVTNIYISDPENVETINRQEISRISPVPKGNNLLVNDGDGTFTDNAPEHGLEKGGWGWASTVADFTNDGHLDIVHGVTAVEFVTPYDEVYRTIQMWKGTSDSWEKLDGAEHGMEIAGSRGVARIDYDNDGTLDIAVATASPPPSLDGDIVTTDFRLYENQGETDDALQFYVRHPEGIERNAAVYVETDKRTVYRRASSRGDFLSQDSRLLHFGTANEEVESVTVLWSDGTKSEYGALEEGNRYILRPESFEVVEVLE